MDGGKLEKTVYRLMLLLLINALIIYNIWLCYSKNYAIEYTQVSDPKGIIVKIFLRKRGYPLLEHPL